MTSLLDLLIVGPKFTRTTRHAAARARLQQQTRGRRSKGQTDRRTDRRTFGRFMTLTAYRTMRTT